MKSPLHSDVEMEAVTKYGITYDYCPVSKGIWLDKGELEKVIEYVTKNKRGDDRSGSDQNERENPLVDLFDIFPF